MKIRAGRKGCGEPPARLAGMMRTPGNQPRVILQLGIRGIVSRRTFRIDSCSLHLPIVAKTQAMVSSE